MHRRQPAPTVMVVVSSLLLLLATGCGDGSASDSGGAAPTGVILPVWALLDGDTPVAGARVQVYAQNGRALQRLHPIGGDLQSTADSGLALLEFDQLPPSFLVLVRGGRAEGRTLRGSLSAQVRGYDEQLVQVTPVTSLAERLGRDDRAVDRTAEVHAALAIPDWADEFDLHASDAWFDGDAFLAYTDGNLAEALPRLAAEIARGENEIFPADGDNSAVTAPGTPPEASKWWEEGIPGLIAGGFQQLAYSLISDNLEDRGGSLLGRMLDYWGLKSLAELVNGKPDTQVIIEILQDLSKRVSKLQETVESTKLAVAESQYSLLVKDMSRDWTTPIDALSLQLKAVAAAPAPKTPEEDARRVRYARDVAERIRANFVDRFATQQMHQSLDTDVPAANDILKAASQIYGARRWFTAESSANINTIFEYFAVYQLRLAILLTNYEASIAGFSAAEVQADIDAIAANIAKQKADRLKPAVPDDKFVDTRNMKMWDRKPVWVHGQGYSPHEECVDTRHATLICTLNDPTWTERSRPLATVDEYKALIEGWHGDNPLQWLRAIGLVTSAPSGTRADWVGHMWLGPEPVSRIHCATRCWQRLTRVNLSESDRDPHVFTTDLYDFDPQFYYAHAMTVQAVEPGTYWWPFGGQ